MKLQRLLQNLMILIAIVLLLVGFLPGIVTQTSVSDNGTVIAEKYSFFTLSDDTVVALPFFLLTSLVCIGAIAFRVSGAGKPLDWTLAASALGVTAYMLSLFSQENGAQLHISILVLILFIAELVLTLAYKVGRHTGFLV